MKKYTGSSINSLVIVYVYDMSSLEYMSRYDIDIELLRGITGSLGVIFTVPLVSFITLFLTDEKNHYIGQFSVNCLLDGE